MKEKTDTPRVDALFQSESSYTLTPHLWDLSRQLERDNAQLRECLKRLEGRMRAFISHGLDAKQRQIEHWADTARAAQHIDTKPPKRINRMTRA